MYLTETDRQRRTRVACCRAEPEAATVVSVIRTIARADRMAGISHGGKIRIHDRRVADPGLALAAQLFGGSGPIVGFGVERTGSDIRIGISSKQSQPVIIARATVKMGARE